MTRKVYVILGSLIIGTLFALLETYKEYKYITASSTTVVPIAGFVISTWSTMRDGK